MGEYVVQKRTLEEVIGIFNLINKEKRRLMGITDIKEKVGMPIMKTLKSAVGHRNLNEMLVLLLKYHVFPQNSRTYP